MQGYLNLCLQQGDDGGAVDSHPLYQDMFGNLFDDLQNNFCSGLDLSAASDLYPCWNGTHVANYSRDLTYFNEVRRSYTLMIFASKQLPYR